MLIYNKLVEYKVIYRELLKYNLFIQKDTQNSIIIK